MKLNNQEIRNCIYSGALNNLLRELNADPGWMKLNRMKKAIGYRFTKQELILRVFAFNDRYQAYGGRLARFLNEYMEDNKNPSATKLQQKKDMFLRTVGVVFTKIFDGKAPPKMPISVFETLLVGVSFNLQFLEAQSASRVKQLYKVLLAHEELSEAKLSEGLSGKARVIGRIEAAKGVLSEKLG
jgi:hypothetical protein